MKLLRLEAHNVMGTKDVVLEGLDGHHLFLVGGTNGQAKTSTIKSVLMAVCGRSGMDFPEVPLRNGEDEGWVKLDLSGDSEIMQPEGITVELGLERHRDGSTKETFRVLDADDNEAPSPRDLLKSLYMARAFDPLSFDGLDKKKRREVLMDLVGLDLDAFQAKTKELYDERKGINAQGKRDALRVEQMPSFPDAPDEEIVVHKVVEELDAAKEHNQAVKAAADHVSDMEADAKTQADEVERLEAELAQAIKDRETAEKAHKKAKAAAKKLGDEKPVEELSAKIKESGEINVQVQANIAKAKAEEELDDLRKQSKKLTDQMADLAKEQDKKLAKADWPVPGMSVDSEGVLFSGVPWEQASKRERTIASTHVGVAQNPKLRLLVCEDGSDLDTETLKALDEFLKEKDFQMLLEVVTRTNEDEEMCQVIIEDGEIKPAKKGKK